jgi:hypothetical protein
MLPIPLTRKENPRTAAARPLAPRVLEVSWVVTAATPANTTPTAAIAAPAANAPTTGCPVAVIARPTNTASTTLATTATINAAARPAYRPTPAAPISSARPVSSLCRVCRTTVKMLMSAASTASSR